MIQVHEKVFRTNVLKGQIFLGHFSFCHIIFFGYDKIDGNTNALKAAFSLALLRIRLRNEQAINSTRNRVYSLKVFCFLLYQCRYFLFVSELI